MAFEGFLRGRREKKESVEAPKTFSGVRFEGVFDGSGNYIRSKSSSFGRKEIRYEGEKPISSFDKYDVEVISDSEPNNPNGGYYEVKILDVNREPIVFESSDGYDELSTEARYLENEQKKLEEKFRSERVINRSNAFSLAQSLVSLEDRFQQFAEASELIRERKEVPALIKSTVGGLNSYSAFLKDAKRRLVESGYQSTYELLRYPIPDENELPADESVAYSLNTRFTRLRTTVLGSRTLDPFLAETLISDLTKWKEDYRDFKVYASETDPGEFTKELYRNIGSLDAGELINAVRTRLGEYYVADFDRATGDYSARLSRLVARAGDLTDYRTVEQVYNDLDVLRADIRNKRNAFLDTLRSIPSEKAAAIDGAQTTLANDVNRFLDRIVPVRDELRTEQRRAEIRESEAREERIRAERQRLEPKPVSVETLVENAIYDEGGIMEERHKEVLRGKVRRLKRSPAFQALTSILHDEELARPYNLMLSRKEEMLEDQNEDERHRSLAPMFASLMMHERTKELTELTINESVRDRSALIKEAVAEARNRGAVPFVREVVIGSGPHSAIYAINRQMVLPDDPSLTLERASVIGGQFAQMGGDLFALNSRTRPERRGQNYLPGTANSLNTFTAFATTQPGDTGGEAYQKQSVLGDHARLNLFLSGEAVVGADVRRIRQLPDSDRYIVEFLDSSKNRILEVETNRIIFTTGVGEEETRLDEDDRTTREILEAEKKKFEEGKDALVLSFSEAAARLADPENPFPLKDFKRIILSGEGDGGKVLAGVLLGYEGQLAMTATQLDNVEEIVWLGQSYPTKEAFIENCRARYHQIGLEFPRERFEQYYGRIKPKPGERAERLVRSGDEIQVISSSGNDYTGDHFIYAHGFTDRTSEIIAPVFNTDSYTDYYPDSKEELNSDVSSDPQLFFFEPGVARRESEERYKSTDVVRIETKPVLTGVEVTRVLRDGTYTVSNPAEFSAEALYKELQERAGEFVNCLPVLEYRGSEATVYTAPGDTTPSARKYSRQNIYRVGPSANLPLTAEERRESEALATISENTAAVFRYANKTARLAIELARLDAESRPVSREKDLYAQLSNREQTQVKIALPPIPKRASKAEQVAPSIQVYQQERIQRVPYAMPNGDLLRLGLGSVLENYTAPESVTHVEVSVTRTGDSESASYNLMTDAKLPNEYREAIRKAFGSELSRTALERFFERKQHRDSVMNISIPFTRGKVDPGKIGFTRSGA